MLITKKMLLALTLVGALVGAGVGSLITRSASSTQAANDNYQTTPLANTTATTPQQLEAANASEFRTNAEQIAYRQGFEEGYGTCDTARTNATSRGYSTYRAATYRAPVRRASTRSSRVYYDYNNSQPKGRSFWQKHRDKLTMAIGTGAGAGVGALIGGKKGAGIGSLVGLGGSALYTYKLRKRSPRRY
jgi:hypothetical protein